MDTPEAPTPIVKHNIIYYSNSFQTKTVQNDLSFWFLTKILCLNMVTTCPDSIILYTRDLYLCPICLRRGKYF